MTTKESLIGSMEKGRKGMEEGKKGFAIGTWSESEGKKNPTRKGLRIGIEGKKRLALEREARVGTRGKSSVLELTLAGRNQRDRVAKEGAEGL